VYGNINDKEKLLENLAANSIPENIVTMDYKHYEEFLLERRKLMAKKIQGYYYSL
jgi:pantothenate kinase